MRAHDAHDHPGNDPRQILKDGCPECELRGADPLMAIRHMDPQRFREAVARAITWQTQRDYVDRIGIPSDAEARTLEIIFAVLSALRMALPPDLKILRSEYGGQL